MEPKQPKRQLLRKQLSITQLRKAAGTDRLLDWLLSSSRGPPLGTSRGDSGSKAFTSFLQSKAESISGPETSLFLVKTFYSPGPYSKRKLSSQRPGSLQLVFDYYSTLLHPSQVFCGTGVARCLTYADIQAANSHVSLPELTRFARTFGIIPNLLSLQGVHYAWQRQKFENVGRENSTMLDYGGFVEVLARCALLAFPNLKEPRDRVKALAGFLDLSNTRKYRMAIAAMKRHEDLKINSMVEHWDARSDAYVSAREDSDTARRVGDEKQGFGAHTVDRLRDIAVCGDYSYIPVSKPKWTSIRVGKRLAKYLPRKTAASISNKDARQRSVDSIRFATRKTERLSTKTSNKTKALLHRARRLSRSVEAVPRHASKVEARKKVAFTKQDVHYTGNLLEELHPYRFDHSPVRWLPYEEPSIDMGVLRLGSTYRYKIQVLNTMSHKTSFQFYIHNLPGSSITFDAKDAAAGIERTAVMQVQAMEEGEYVGAVQCVARTTYGEEIEHLHIPAYCAVQTQPSPSGNLHPGGRHDVTTKCAKGPEVETPLDPS